MTEKVGKECLKMKFYSNGKICLSTQSTFGGGKSLCYLPILKQKPLH